MSNKFSRGFGGRPYAFFDREPVADNLTNILGAAYRAVVSFEGLLVFADESGNVTFTDSDLRVSIQQHMISGPALLLARSRQTPPLFVVVGPEAGGALIVKTWVGSKLASPANALDLNQLLKGAYPLDVTALACNFDGTKIALGFKSGLIVLLEGDFARDRAKIKTPVVVPPPANAAYPVSALHFLHPFDSSAAGGAGAPLPPPIMPAQNPANFHKLYVLFDHYEGQPQPHTPAPPPPPPPPPPSSSAAATAESGLLPRGGILVYNTADLRARPVVLDELGAAPGCSAVDPFTQDLVVGRPDAMYFYSEEEGKKGAKGFEVKQSLCCLSGSSVLWATVDELSGRSTMSVYDLKNQFVAFHAMLASGHKVSLLVAEGTVAYVFTSQGNVFRLREKDISAKLKILVDDMKLYGVAIKLAYSSNYDVAKIMEIYKLYGNYLYEKKRAYDAAIKQYCNTIGYLDPSYVISRFLDAQRIKNLTTYLEALHRRGHYTSDLTTFLLNCYTKLKDVEKLEKFINQEWTTTGGAAAAANNTEGGGGVGGGGQAAAANGGYNNGGVPPPHAPPASGEYATADFEPPPPPPPGGEGFESVNTAAARRRAMMEGGEGGGGGEHANFDIHNAVQVLKSAGYPDHALELARKYKAHDWYLRIQLEKASPSYRDALLYISGLPFHAAEEHMRTYGKKLMNHLPDDTTAIIIALCIGRFPPIGSPKAGAGGGAAPDFSKEKSLGHQQQQHHDSGGGGGDKAKAENFLHLFVDHPTHLRTFLECVMRKPDVLSVSSSVANTLLELLVQDWVNVATAAGPPSPETERLRKQKAQDLSNFLEQHHGRYDEDHALVLVQMHQFKPGTLFLYDKMRNVDLVIDHFIAEKDTPNVLNRIGRKENKKNADLWVKVLTYVVDNAKPPERKAEGEEGGDGSDDEDDDDDDEEAVWDDIIKVLQMLEKEQVLPPLQVVDILSRNDNIPLFVVKDYVSRLLKEAYADVKSSQTKIDGLRHSTSDMRAEVDALRSTARVFQATKCHGCPRALEVPAVHFLCMHSYHQDPNFNCMDRENECNECAPEHRKYEGIMRAQSGKAMDHEHFFSELEEQGFDAVASYFGKGVIK